MSSKPDNPLLDAFMSKAKAHMADNGLPWLLKPQETVHQDWKATDQDRKRTEIAERYHADAEAYDRTVCTGPILHGAIQPANPRELMLVNINAARLLKGAQQEAARHGIDAADLRRTIARMA